MKTNIDLNETLVAEAFTFAGVSTKRELVEIALREYVENHRRKNLLDLKGKFEFAAGYDHKKMRER